MKINIKDKIALGAVILVTITNPASGQYVLQAIDWIFQRIFIYGGWVNLLGSIILMVYVLSKVFAKQAVNIPKPKKSQAQYIKT